MLAWGDLVSLAAALGWASTTVMARHISRSMPAVWYNALRIIIASVGMLALLPWTLGQTDLSRVNPLAFVFLFGSVLCGFALGDTAFYEGMRRIGVARAAPIAGCHPLVTALLAVLWLGEPVTLWLVGGVVVIGVGVWLITTDQAPTSPSAGLVGSFAAGVGLSLVAAVGWAISTVIVRPALQEIDAVLASTLRLPVAACVLLLVANRLGRLDGRKLVLTRDTAGWLVVSGILTLFSATLFLWSVDLIGAARTAALSSASPIFSATMAVLWLGEVLTVRLVLGMGVSVAGVLLIALTR
ncbi:MAG: DMT family transporter [Chloroflexi bacterium]|nr:DMT family transporter [Chloroflexota bacterium]